MAKLSAAQEKALNEIIELGYTNARKNTMDSIAKYVTAKGPSAEDGLKLNADGREVMGLGEETSEEVSVPEETTQTFHETLMDDVARLEADLDTEWADYSTTTDAWAESLENDLPKDEAPEADGVEYFQDSWTPEEKIKAGFAATLYFRDTHVWDGLTAKEIKADIKTAVPVGREGKRGTVRLARKATNQLFKVA